MPAIVPLYRKKKIVGHALVDKADWPWCRERKWYLDSSGYAISYQVNGKRLGMHRAFFGNPKDFVIDHINSNRRDNRRSNLRLATSKQNSYNVPPIKGARSKYKGVGASKFLGWKAGIKGPRGKRVIGYYPDELTAARAYDEAAAREQGEFAWLNKDHFEEV